MRLDQPIQGSQHQFHQQVSKNFIIFVRESDNVPFYRQVQMEAKWLFLFVAAFRKVQINSLIVMHHSLPRIIICKITTTTISIIDYPKLDEKLFDVLTLTVLYSIKAYPLLVLDISSFDMSILTISPNGANISRTSFSSIS